MSRIYIDNTTYIFVLLSLLSGYFEYVILVYMFIIIHELGHLIAASFMHFKIDKIYIYPLGGITKYNEIINVNIYKELFVLVCGPLVQIFFCLILKKLYLLNLININKYLMIKQINYFLLSFNLLPISLLDGGRLINIIFDFIFPYKKSYYYTLVISIIIIVSTVYLKHNLLIILCLIFLIKNNIIEFNKFKYRYNKFLLERLIYNLNIKKSNKVIIFDNIKRNISKNILYKDKVYTEKEFLNRIYFKY